MALVPHLVPNWVFHEQILQHVADLQCPPSPSFTAPEGEEGEVGWDTFTSKQHTTSPPLKTQFLGNATSVIIKQKRGNT